VTAVRRRGRDGAAARRVISAPPSNPHPIIVSAILNLTPFWAAMVVLALGAMIGLKLWAVTEYSKAP
jgi:hypothetical protein